MLQLVYLRWYFQYYHVRIVLVFLVYTVQNAVSHFYELLYYFFYVKFVVLFLDHRGLKRCRRAEAPFEQCATTANDSTVNDAVQAATGFMVTDTLYSGVGWKGLNNVVGVIFYRMFFYFYFYFIGCFCSAPNYK